ncbi:Cuticlin-1 [Eumeta japonica]|uniref:Cuticlin-1 n=1 Tax=Eumeta variegata TaxID=151549 RepID=A0A4C1WNN0_EUMVA|nr:Cuticlin-1 [Eumeta japonica]
MNDEYAIRRRSLARLRPAAGVELVCVRSLNSNTVSPIIPSLDMSRCLFVEKVVCEQQTNESGSESAAEPDQLAMESSEREPPSHAYSGPPPPAPPRRQAPHHAPHHPIGMPRITNHHQLHSKPFALGPPGGHHKNEIGNGFRGPPPPAPPADAQTAASDKVYSGAGDVWPAPAPDMPKIVSLDVKCEKNAMRVFLSFDQPFFGIVFSKGHYSNHQCVHLPPGLGRKQASFEIGAHACGTAGSGDPRYRGDVAAAGTYFENVIVIQYDPQVQEVWDQARKLRCTWHDQYEKAVTFRPFPVDMLDVVRADFAGDNVGCWMQIQVGKGPWASEVSGLVKIGQTMTMVLAIKDDDAKFDMLVRDCVAHDGQRAPIQLVDRRGCVTRPKLMSRFTKINNFGASASVLSYAHFQAFKFPDSMEVHFQCTIQICRYRCPEQCSDAGHIAAAHVEYGPPQLDAYPAASEVRRDERRVRRQRRATTPDKSSIEEVGLKRLIRVVSAGDLTFPTEETAPPKIVPSPGLVCMTTPGFAATLGALLATLLCSCAVSAVLFLKLRPLNTLKKKTAAVAIVTRPAPTAHVISKSRFYS